MRAVVGNVRKRREELEHRDEYAGVRGRRPETERYLPKGDVPNKGARGARDPGRARTDLIVFGVEPGQPEGAHDDSHDENGEKHGQEPGPGIALAVPTVAREPAHRRGLVPRGGVLWLLHHLADDVAGVHLGVLGGARQRVAFIPHPAAARLVALRRRIRSRVRPGVKTWAHAEKSHCFRCSGAGDEASRVVTAQERQGWRQEFQFQNEF